MKAFECSAEVESALAEGRAVVALESTILAHGFPHPDGRVLADELEGAVRAGGAVPATIAVIDGVLRVGLDPAQLDRITDPGAPVGKAAALDLGWLRATGATAATTVSATCRASALAGIRVFATGGIGGVHRGDSGDVSSDLSELARSPVAVVSAGAKAILDLPRTLEALETLGVWVVGWNTAEMPAFYSRRSGLRLEHSCSDLAILAGALRARFELYGQGGALVCNPIPEADEIPADEIASAIAEALIAADSQRVTGKALTPFLLARLAEVSAGRSVIANRALALANAELGAALALSYAEAARGD